MERVASLSNFFTTMNIKLAELVNPTIPRDVTNLETRLKANSSLVTLFSRINTSDELLQALKAILSMVDQTVTYNNTKILVGVKDHLKDLSAGKLTRTVDPSIAPAPAI